MTCPKCQYEWESIKEHPKSCPRCKTRLDVPSMKMDELRKTAEMYPLIEYVVNSTSDTRVLVNGVAISEQPFICFEAAQQAAYEYLIKAERELTPGRKARITYK